MRSRPLALPALVIVAALATTARASTFDETTGKIVLDRATYVWGLDALADQPGGHDYSSWYALDPDFNLVSEGVLARRFASDEEGALEGKGYLEFGGDLSELDLDLFDLGRPLEGRRAEISFWYRARGTRVVAVVQWTRGLLSLLPTGRATDDGWVELSTGPFDWSLAGSRGPLVLAISDPHGPQWTSGSGTIALDRFARVDLDAFEIRDLGPAEVPAASCTVPDEDEVCGEEGLCLLGRCVDAAPVVGPAFATAELRKEYIDRQAAHFELFDGSRMAARLMPAFEQTLQTLVDEPSPKRFWPAFDAAVQNLRDGHASAPALAYGFPVSGGACVNLGEADLLPGGGEAPIVFRAVADGPDGVQLQPGDVVTAVDGLPWREWRDRAARLFSYPGDPAARDVMTAAQLLDAAALAGAKVTFGRCPALDAAGTGCDGVTETFDVDYAKADADLWRGAPPAWESEDLGCDFRFRRVPEVSGPTAFDLAATTVQDGVTYVVFNAFPNPDRAYGEGWAGTIHDALAWAPGRIVVDERTGYGGVASGVTYLASFFLGEADFDLMELYPQLDWDLDAGLNESLRQCTATPTEIVPCGYFEQWAVTDTSNDAVGAASSARVALLLGMDVSGNDFFTKLMTYRSAETRIFGPAGTWGAFGAVFGLPAPLGEISGGSFQILDTKFFGTVGGPEPEFSTGTGVPPHEVVLQKQSDAMRGVDTLLEAAAAWVNQ